MLLLSPVCGTDKLDPRKYDASVLLGQAEGEEVSVGRLPGVGMCV